MRTVLAMLLVILAVFAGLWTVADWLRLSLFTTVLVATIGALVCLLGFVVFPTWRRRRAHREYHELLRVGRDVIVSKARYRECRILHYRDGSVVAKTKRGMQSFQNFDECRRFIDGR